MARVIGYCRRSTDEQVATMDAQDDALRRWADEQGHIVVDVRPETISGGIEPEDRPVLGEVLDVLGLGEADVLAVTTTDRLARTAATHRLDYYAARQGWRLEILDEPDRLNNPEAALSHGIRVAVAAYERALIGRRTRIALAQRRRAGVRLGRPRSCSDEVMAQVVALRVQGLTMEAIAERMNEAGPPTPGGGARWWRSHVSRLLATQDARALVAKVGAAAGSPAR